MTDALPTSSVVVVTRDRPGFAAAAARSVLAGDLQPDEVVVVDQSATRDAHLDELERTHPTVRHLRVRELGLSLGRNVGATEACGDIVAFLDDDELAERGWLAALVSTLAAFDGDTVATGRVLPGEAEVRDAVVPSTVLPSEPALFRGRLARDMLAGGNMAARRSTFLAVGGFDTRLGPGTLWPAAEDNDLGLRLLVAGYTIAYVPTAVVVHRAWRAGASYPRIRWRYGLGKGGFYAKHLTAGGVYGLRRAIRDVGKRLARAPIAVWRRPRYALGELTYAAGVLVGIARWGLRRNRS